VSELFERFRAAQQAIIKQDDEAFLDLLTDDVEYHYHVGTRPLIGKEWVQKFLIKYREVTSDAQWVIHNHAENGNVLFTEGIEEYFDVRSQKTISHPYAGVIEFRDGKIVKWKDYFEMNSIRDSED
tara:strand:+ start:38 stop:415 length:378 start_codon:yes stop_codon:yes gene_type:complete